MHFEVFAEWLRRQGYHVISSESSYWFNLGPRVYQACPYHWLINPSDEELTKLLRDNSILGVRYSTPVNHKEGAISYHTICDNKNYDIKSVDGSSRSVVRRGLEACTVKNISFEQYAEEGWLIQRDTESRQGRTMSKSQKNWRNRALAAIDLEGFEVWGAFVDSHLAATVFCAQIDDCVNLLYQQSLREYLPYRVNNALTFKVTQELIRRPSVNLLHYGLHSLDAPASVDKFKVSMGYTLRPVRQRVFLNPRIPHNIVLPTNKIMQEVGKIFPKNNTVHKTEGFLRFYVNGHLPIAEQQLPELLEKRKEEIIQMSIENKQIVTAKPKQYDSYEQSKYQKRLKEMYGFNMRIAVMRDAQKLAYLHYKAAKFQPGAFLHKLGLRFLGEYYKLLIEEGDELILCAVDELDNIVGFISGTYSAQDHFRHLGNKRWRLFLSLSPKILLSPTLLFGLWHRSRIIYEPHGKFKYVVPFGCRIEYWAWDPNLRKRNGSVLLLLAFLEKTKHKGILAVRAEADVPNRSVLVTHLMIGAKIIARFTTPDKRERIILEHRFDTSKSEPGVENQTVA